MRSFNKHKVKNMSDRKGRPPRRFSPSPKNHDELSDKQIPKRKETPVNDISEAGTSKSFINRRIGRKRTRVESANIDVVETQTSDFVIEHPSIGSNFEDSSELGKRKRRTRQSERFVLLEQKFSKEEECAPVISPQSSPPYQRNVETPLLRAGDDVEIDPVGEGKEAIDVDEPPCLSVLEKNPMIDREKDTSGFTFEPFEGPSMINANDLEANRFYSLRYLFISMEPELTEYGDKYLTVRRESIADFLNKDSILDCIVNCTRNTHEMGWVNCAPPLLPPEVENSFTFCFLIDGNQVQPQKTRLDALSPWSRSKEDFSIDGGVPLPTLRCKQRTISVIMEAGRCRVGQGAHRSSPYSLHEYTAVHPCSNRLKKRIYYITRDEVPFGDIMVIYEFLIDGPFPQLTKKMQHVLDMYKKGNFCALVTILPGQAGRFEGNEKNPDETHLQIDQKNIITEIVEVEDVLEEEEYISTNVFSTLPQAQIDEEEILDVVQDLSLTDGDSYTMSSLEKEKLFSRSTGRALEKDWKNHPFVENELITMDDGSRCIRAHTVVWAKEKESLLRFLINDPKKILPEWISPNKPTLPPLVTACTAFVFFVDVDNIDFNDLTSDDLMPWTTNGFHSKTRKIGMTRLPDDMWKLDFGKNWKRFETFLVEYSAVLGRCPRLRKRIIYVRSMGHPIGRCIFSYEYVEDGPKPTINTEFLEKKSRQETIRVERQKQNRSRLPRFFSKDFEEVDEVIDEDGFLREEIVEDLTALDEIPIDGTPGTSFGLIGEDELRLSTDHLEHYFLEDESLEQPNIPEISVYGPEEPLSNHEFFAAVRVSQVGDICVRLNDPTAIYQKANLLSWMNNETNYLESNRLIQQTRPECPPLVENEETFVFFVDNRFIDRKSLYRDALSPWTGTMKGEKLGSSSNTKSQKWGLEKTGNGELISVGIRQAFDPKIQYVLFENYCVHFRFPRLQRRIYHILNQITNQIVGNIVIAYVYNNHGPAPTLNSTKLVELQIESFTQKMPLNKPYSEMIDLDNRIPVLGNSFCFRVRDTRLVYDRRRILDLAFNEADLVSELGLLNDSFPRLPPLTTEIDCFVCFIDAKSCSIIDQRHLTVDALSPWSEGQRGDEVFIRPKIKRYLLFRNKNKLCPKLELLPGSLSNALSQNEIPCEYSLIVYTATLPRCQRLKKRIYYVMCGRCIVGNVIIFYTYDLNGPLPTEISHGNCKISTLDSNRPFKFDDSLHSLHSLTKQPQAKINDFRDLRIDVCAFLKASRRGELDSGVEWAVEKRRKRDRMDQLKQKSVEEIQEASTAQPQSLPVRQVANEVQKKIDAIIDFTAYQFDSRSENEVLDALWQVLLFKNEDRLLHNIKEEYGIEFVANEQANEVLMADVQEGQNEILTSPQSVKFQEPHPKDQK
ncbi:unnamed protein product, partial [Mesorhabditis belari]|uniref:DUF7747 domain-containing protein n=1 Tax=Mesorhabditis belari TaxID=2138241 RepID=A0AAF3FGY7_9BILA